MASRGNGHGGISGKGVVATKGSDTISSNELEHRSDSDKWQESWLNVSAQQGNYSYITAIHANSNLLRVLRPRELRRNGSGCSRY